MGLSQGHEGVPHICGYLSNGLKKLNYHIPNKGKKIKSLNFAQKSEG